MENGSNKFKSSTSSAQYVAVRKRILDYLNREANKHADQISNAQREIAAVKVILTDARQRLERINHRQQQTK